MKWVGGDNIINETKHLDLDLIISNIKGLNALVKKDEFYLQKGKINQFRVYSRFLIKKQLISKFVNVIYNHNYE